MTNPSGTAGSEAICRVSATDQVGCMAHLSIHPPGDGAFAIGYGACRSVEKLRLDQSVASFLVDAPYLR
jgi:hypothetical protein